MTGDLLSHATKKVLVDPHPAWGGVWVAVAAAVLFVLFSGWVIFQRVRHGKDGDDE